jgi:beta-xylosidase
MSKKWKSMIQGLFFPAITVVIASVCTNGRADVGYIGAWGDQGDGTYKNPVLPGCYGDLDAIRVDSNFYMITTTGGRSPGMAVCQSKDLVNWTIAGHVAADITPYSGAATWAGSIRYYLGKFWVYFNANPVGLFMSSAVNAAGPWEPMTRVTYDTDPTMPGTGWDDCCTLLDDVMSNYANNYNIHMFKMTLDGKKLIAAGDKIIYQAHGSEANKLYKINGYYYHLFSQAGVSGHRVVMMERSTNIFGPYTGATGGAPTQVEESIAGDREPNQGGLIQAPSGDWWWFTHEGLGNFPEGRNACLMPVTWKANGFPVFGVDNNNNGIGELVWSYKKPVLGRPIMVPQSSDEFSGATLMPQWEWTRQPKSGEWSLSANSGFLRLYASGIMLTQKFMKGDTGLATCKVDISKMVDNQEAGLCHYDGAYYARIGIAQTGGVRRFKYNDGGSVTLGPTVSGTTVWLRSKMDKTPNSTSWYSTDGVTFTQLGGVYLLKAGDYYGFDKLALYSFNNTTQTGSVDFDWFHYTYAGPTPSPVITNEQRAGQCRHSASVNRKVFLKNGALYFDAFPTGFRGIEIVDLLGKTLFRADAHSAFRSILLPEKLGRGSYFIRFLGIGPSIIVPVVSL